MKVINYFGSPLVRTSVSSDLLNDLNSVADQMVARRNSELAQQQSSKLFSAVNLEMNFPLHLMSGFEGFLKSQAQTFHENFALPSPEVICEFRIGHIWIISQLATEWGHLHAHTGAISGIIYLKVPENMAEGLSSGDKRIERAGCIDFTEGTPGDYRRSILTVKPKVGELYLFPADLAHTIYPFFGSEERRSLSFNVSVVKTKR